MGIYLGDSVRLAILREGGGPGAVGSQLGHYHSGRIGRHCASSEKRRGASALRRRPAGAGWIGSDIATNFCPFNASGRAKWCRIA